MNILCICLGNICRSPAAEAILSEIAGPKHDVISRGVDEYHVGEKADARMRRAAKERGIEIETRAKVLTQADVDWADYLLVATEEILEALKMRLPDSTGKIFLMTHWSQEHKDVDVPDPYYSRTDAAFEEVIDLLEESLRCFCECELDAK